MDDAIFRVMMDSPIMGFAHHRIILDDEGNPSDYEFLVVNTTFEKLTGLSREKILGHRVREAIPGIEAEEFDWIAFYGAVALGGGEKSFEQFSQPLERWYRVHVYSTEKFYFSTVFIDITESKKQTAEVEGFFSVNLDLLCIADLEGNFIKANEAWEAILGYSPDELSSRKFLEFVHPEDISATMEAMSTLGQGDDVLNFTNRYRCRDGSFRYIEWRSHPMGNLIYAAARDVTQRMEAEKALKQANDVVENMQLGLYVYQLEDMDDDRTLRLTYANPATQQMTGLEVADIVGKTLDENFPLLRGMGVPQRYAQVVRSGQEETFEELYYSDDRVAESCFVVKAFPLPSQQVGIAFDAIAERVAAKNAVAASNARLQEAQEVGNVGSWEYDLLTDALSWSNQTYKIYGESPDSFAVSFNNVIAHYPGEERERVLDAFNQAVDETGALRIDHEIIAGNGERRFVQEVGKMIVTEDGKERRMVGSVVDITDRRKAEEALANSEQRLNTILSNTPAVIYTYTIAKNGSLSLTYINDNVEKVLGYKPHEFIENMELWASCVHPDDMQKLQEKLSGAQTTSEYRFKDRAGNYRWLLDNQKVLRIKDGETEIIGTWWDITEKKKAEEKLATSEERFNRAISGTGAGLWDWDIVNNTVYFSPQWKKMLGYEDDEIPNDFSGWRKLWHPDDATLIEKATDDHLEGRSKVYEVEHRLLGKDGSWHWILTQGELEKDLSGRPIRWTGTNIDITDRKLAEAALRAREENFRLFFDAMQDMVVVGTPAGHVLYANQALLDTLGYSLAELDQLGVLGVHPPELQAEAQEILAEMLRGERSYCPLPVQAKDGRLVPVETRISLGQWFGEDCIFGVIKNLSEEQAALQKFDKLFDVNPTPMALSRLPERRYVEINRSFLQFIGYNREESLGKSPAELGIFAEPVYMQQTNELLKKDGFIRNLELQIRTKAGEYRDGLFSAEIIEVQGIRYVLSVMVDITERKKAEDELQKSEVKYRSLIENINDIVYLLTSEGVLMFVSPSWTRLLGYEVAEVEGQSFADFVHPDDVPACVSFLQKVVESGERQEGIEYRVRHKNGTWYWHSSSANPRRDVAGNVVGFNGLARDITDRKKAEEQLAEMSFLQGFLVEIATAFIDVPLQAAHSSIEHALGELGRFIGADRAYIFSYDWDAQVTRNTFEWCGEGVEPQIENLQNVPLEDIPEWTTAHRAGRIVLVEDVGELDPEASLWQILEPQGVQSLISLPMMDGGQCLGFIGFDSVREKKTYSDDAQKLLFVFALMLVSLEKRNRTQEELATALRAAEAASVAKGQFLANMSHEIRTPGAGRIRPRCQGCC